MRGRGAQRIEHAAQPRGREIVLRQADRPVIGKAQPLQQHDAAAGPNAERRGDVRFGRGFLELQHASGGLLVVPADPLGEARARLDRVFQHVLGDERAAPLLHAHQPAARQFLQRAAHGVAIDAELLRQLGLGRQAAARRIDCRRRYPAAGGWRSAATAQRRPGAAPAPAASSQCHPSAAPIPCNSWLDDSRVAG